MDNRYFKFIPLPDGAPHNAHLCITVSGDELLPYYAPGQRVYVDRKAAPKELQIGVFYYKGAVYCRQWCIDIEGTLYLLPSNPKRMGNIVTIPAADVDKCLCLGSVISEHTLGMPVYE